MLHALPASIKCIQGNQKIYLTLGDDDDDALH